MLHLRLMGLIMPPEVAARSEKAARTHEPDRINTNRGDEKMGWGTPDVYYQPEEFGLTIFGSIEDPEADYSFDTLMVWKDQEGSLFWAQDSGCSCPSPFENFTSIDDLHKLTNETWAAFKTDVDGHCNYNGYDWKEDEGPEPHAADKTQLLAKVALALRA